MKKTLSPLGAITPGLIAFVFVLMPHVAFAQSFVPLNPIPGIIEAGNSPSLPAFFNGLYKICIGAAATVAVLQIMRAGFLFMVNKGSVSHNEQAKSIITNSVLGLLLVLSPAIVFGIINPKILNLSLDVTNLQPTITSQSFSTTTAQANNTCAVYSAFAVKKNPGGDATGLSCDDNWVKAPNTCCSLNATDEICCAQVAKSQYLLAYTYTVTAPGKAACRPTPVPTYYGDKTECTTQLNFVKTHATTLGNDLGSSNLQVLQACVPVSNATYKVPDNIKPALCK